MDYIVFARNARGVQGLRASRRARWDCPARDNRMPMQVPAGAEGASAAEGRAASGRCGRRPQHRCERADARDMERAAREHRMRSRCAAGAEGARAAEGRVAPPLPHQRLSEETFGYSEWGFQPAVAPPYNARSRVRAPGQRMGACLAGRVASVCGRSRERVVLRNTGDGSELRVFRHVTRRIARRTR